ncbi:hypothetical protein ACFU6I_07045 [Streptomyces sp. NPDC057486]
MSSGPTDREPPGRRTPRRSPAPREVNEIPDREPMRDGRWLL